MVHYSEVLATFLQVIIDPVEYESLQSRLFASFMNVKTELLLIAFIILLACFIYGWRLLRDLDVVSLGRDNAINLGVNYDKMVLKVIDFIFYFNCYIYSACWTGYVFRFNCSESFVSIFCNV